MSQRLWNGFPLSWEPHYKLHYECHEGEGNRCLGNVMGECQGGALLSVHRAMTTVVDNQTSEGAKPNGYNEVVLTRNMETIEAFSSHVISIKMEKKFT